MMGDWPHSDVFTGFWLRRSEHAVRFHAVVVRRWPCPESRWRDRNPVSLTAPLTLCGRVSQGLLLVMVALGGVIGAEADPRRMPTMANSMFSRTMLRRAASTGSAFDSMQGSGRASPPPVQRSDSRDWGSDAAEEGSGRGALIVAVRGGAEGSETQRGEERGGGSEENVHGEQQTSTTMWGNNGASTEQSLFGYGADEAKDENGFVTDYQGEGDVPDARTMGGWLYDGIRPSITQEESIMGGGTSASRSPRTQLDPDETLRLHNKLMTEARDRGVLPHFSKDSSNAQVQGKPLCIHTHVCRIMPSLRTFALCEFAGSQRRALPR